MVGRRRRASFPSFAAAGKYLPRTASQQYASAPVHVPISQARRGDLLVWGSAPNFYHVAIYLGNGQVVQALNPEEGIGVTSLDDARLQGKHIGVVAGTPPATIMAHDGLMALAKPYPLTVDTRVMVPAKEMADDIAAGRIDAGVLWGPMAGYYARRVEPHLTVTPLLKEHERMEFRIAMGVRRTDQEWKRKLNRLIVENRPEIDRILSEYGVPLLDEQGKPVSP